jgi:spore maturation protein CgeB
MTARPPGLMLENRYLLGDEYAKGMCAFDINLCFLRKINRDLQTTRSIEIPACGAFMAAERTAEHLALFVEGKEAVFFRSNDELIEKCRYYLDHPEERMRIAAAGRQRCLSAGYSNHDRMKAMLREIPMKSPR